MMRVTGLLSWSLLREYFTCWMSVKSHPPWLLAVDVFLPFQTLRKDLSEHSGRRNVNGLPGIHGKNLRMASWALKHRFRRCTQSRCWIGIVDGPRLIMVTYTMVAR